MLISAGYFWARSEHWLVNPVRGWTWDPNDREAAQKALVADYRVTSEQAAARLELAIVKAGIGDLMPPRDSDMPARLEHYRQATIDSLLSLDLVQGSSSLAAAEARAWMSELFAWGVAIGVRRRLYDSNAKYAQALLSAGTRSSRASGSRADSAQAG